MRDDQTRAESGKVGLLDVDAAAARLYYCRKGLSQNIIRKRIGDVDDSISTYANIETRCERWKSVG